MACSRSTRLSLICHNQMIYKIRSDQNSFADCPSLGFIASFLVFVSSKVPFSSGHVTKPEHFHFVPELQHMADSDFAHRPTTDHISQLCIDRLISKQLLHWSCSSNRILLLLH